MAPSSDPERYIKPGRVCCEYLSKFLVGPIRLYSSYLAAAAAEPRTGEGLGLLCRTRKGRKGGLLLDVREGQDEGRGWEIMTPLETGVGVGIGYLGP